MPSIINSHVKILPLEQCLQRQIHIPVRPPPGRYPCANASAYVAASEVLLDHPLSDWASLAVHGDAVHVAVEHRSSFSLMTSVGKEAVGGSQFLQPGPYYRKHWPTTAPAKLWDQLPEVLRGQPMLSENAPMHSMAAERSPWSALVHDDMFCKAMGCCQQVWDLALRPYSCALRVTSLTESQDACKIQTCLHNCTTEC